MHLLQNISYAKTNLLVIWNTSAKKLFDSDKSSIFCAPTKSLKYRHFCCTTESEENGSSECCDVYPGRSNISRLLIPLRMMQNISKKCAETPSRGAIGCCSNIPDKKDILYNLMAMIGDGDDQWKRKRCLILSTYRTSELTIEELVVEFVPQTFKRYFQNFPLKAN